MRMINELLADALDAKKMVDALTERSPVRRADLVRQEPSGENRAARRAREKAERRAAGKAKKKAVPA